MEVIHKTFDLTGCDVTKLEFNYSVRILIADANNSISILIETELLLQIEGAETRIYPGGAENKITALPMAPLLHLLHKPAKLVTFSSNGDLRLEMMDDTVISVVRDKSYESWEANGDGRFAEIAMLCSGHDGPPWAE